MRIRTALPFVALFVPASAFATAEPPCVSESDLSAVGHGDSVTFTRPDPTMRGSWQVLGGSGVATIDERSGVLTTTAPGDIEVLSVGSDHQTVCLTRLTVHRTVVAGQKLTSIQLTDQYGAASASTPIGGPETVQLATVFTPSTAANIGLTWSVDWPDPADNAGVDNPGHTVDSSGLVTCFQEDHFYVKAVAVDGSKATDRIAVVCWQNEPG